MRNESLSCREEFIKFLESPSGETYLACRAKLVASPQFAPYSDDLSAATELHHEGRFAEVQNLIRTNIGNLLLSPLAHLLLALASRELGEDEPAQLEMMISRACITGILGTGDGSAKNPFVVVRTSDEHDVLGALGKQLSLQSLVHDDDKYLDHLECTDGSEYWFDITDAFNRLAESADD